MPLEDWNKGDYSLSIKKIDEQHEKWIEIMNKLHLALLDNKSNNVIEETISDLLDYTINHFSQEDKLMKKMNYPEFSSHRAQHKAFKTEISQLESDFHSNEYILSSQLMSRLKNWLLDHIVTEDKKYADYYHERDFSYEQLAIN